MLQLTDKSLVKPYGVLKDLCVRVEKFLTPPDFYILDIEEDKKMTLIFGTPFLATGDAVIEVK